MANIINWDNKFGVIEGGKKVIDGIGKNAEVVANQLGGLQSKSPVAMHLLDTQFLNDWFNNPTMGNSIIWKITEFMRTGNRGLIRDVIYELQELISGENCNSYECLLTIAKVLQYGAKTYCPNNWRLIPQEDHINHALIHYIAYLLGDTQDEHLEHCMCRLMMAYATRKTEGFKYDKYVPKKLELVQG